MGRVYLNFDKKKCKWKEVEKSDFWIDKAFLNKLDGLRMIREKNWDGVIVIDGKERSGKSILGMIAGWYLSDCKLTVNNFAKGLEDAARKIAKLPDKSVLIMDEGSTVFGSKDSMGGAQKKLIKLMDVVGQKNLIFIICLPCYFDLNKTIAVRRSLFLCHVYPTAEYDRGQYAFWGERRKKMLYKHGKQNYDSYAFPDAEFVGSYLDFKPHFYEEYLEKVKKESLAAVLADALDDTKDAASEVRKAEAIIYGYMRYVLDIPAKEIQKIRKQGAMTVNSRLHAYKELHEVEIPRE
jgi:hypothetical protein